jgi:hypothetical protein
VAEAYSATEASTPQLKAQSLAQTFMKASQMRKFKMALEDSRMDYAMASMLTTQQLFRDLQE